MNKVKDLNAIIYNRFNSVLKTKTEGRNPNAKKEKEKRKSKTIAIFLLFGQSIM